MIFLQRQKYPSGPNDQDSLDDSDEAASSLPKVLTRPGTGYFILDLFQVLLLFSP